MEYRAASVSERMWFDFPDPMPDDPPLRGIFERLRETLFSKQRNQSMPIFEFACRDCSVEFEKLVRQAGVISEAVCPVCGSRKVDEKISAFASISKGSSTTSSGSCAPSGG